MMIEITAEDFGLPEQEYYFEWGSCNSIFDHIIKTWDHADLSYVEPSNLQHEIVNLPANNYSGTIYNWPPGGYRYIWEDGSYSISYEDGSILHYIVGQEDD